MAIDIPNVPGVPSLSSYAPNNVVLLVADLVAAIFGIGGPQWGIFDQNGFPAFDYESVLDFSYKKDAPTSDYQLEDGAFQSYDKVQLAFDVRVRVMSGADEQAREALISSVLAAADTLDLYEVITPEQTFPSCNIGHVDFSRRADNGVGLVVIDVWFQQIRVTSTSTFTNTQSPTTAGQQNSGNVAPQEVPQNYTEKFDSGSWSVQ